MLPLPIDPFVPAIADAVRRTRAAVVTAAPGAGKTTRVPPALAADGPLVLLQPRRVAARAIARRIADEQGWTIGREVGWHVRFDRRASPDTRLLVVTEGMLTAVLQQDPLVSAFTTVVIDEFHERSIHADLAFALVKQAWLARGDLRVVIMSATLDAGPVSAFLGGCPVVDVPGRAFPVETSYRPGADLADVAAECVPSGTVLCFLPGAGDIRSAADRLAAIVPPSVAVRPLHGSLDADAQDAAVAPSATPRIILATNIAETTITVPDVRVVVDTGLQKVARYDARRGVDSLTVERVTQDAADQRTGRAGRVAAGRAIRLWDSRDRLRPHREPDILRVDLAAALLDVVAWGGDPRRFEWFQAPPAEAVERALTLLRQLGAIDEAGRLTPLGADVRRLPLHPRLARLLLEARGDRRSALACALLSERSFVSSGTTATACDLLAAVDGGRPLPEHVVRVADSIARIARDLAGPGGTRAPDDTHFRRAVLAGYPDRVGQRRAGAAGRVLLASGTGARMSPASGVHDGEFLVAVDVVESPPRPGAPPDDAEIRLATRIEREWLSPTHVTTEHRVEPATGAVRAIRTQWYGAIALSQQSVPVEPDVAADLVAEACLTRGPDEDDRRLLARLACAGVALTFDDLVRAASVGRSRLADVDLVSALPADARQRLAARAPDDLPLPSGRRARLDYRDDGRIVAAVKLQELFGLAETPRIGPARVPVTFELLAPNGRPVQVTSDLKSFWSSGYQEVRKALRARYPRHPWPDDPWTATPTHRTARRRH